MIILLIPSTVQSGFRSCAVPFASPQPQSGLKLQLLQPRSCVCAPVNDFPLHPKMKFSSWQAVGKTLAVLSSLKCCPGRGVGTRVPHYTPPGSAAAGLGRICFQRSLEGDWEVAPRQNQLQLCMRSPELLEEDDPKGQLFVLSEL